MSRDVDVLVIGSGIAGLTYALKMAEHASVLLITKKARAESNTNYARGGVAVVLDSSDDVGLHARDTLVAGAGLCHGAVVERVVSEGPDRVRELMAWGTRFDRDEGHLALGMEGGHSHRRIVHVGDRTGRAIESALLAAIESQPNITVLEDVLAVDFIVGEDPEAGGPICAGILALDHRHGRLEVIRSKISFLASGGCGQLYKHTTNPAIATGDGAAMAYRAGAVIRNMEFIQFHPTALHPTEDPAFLISEAVRGEGAILVRQDGTPFMDDYHPQGSLAPRDIVARAIDGELRDGGDDHVLLDVSGISRAQFERHFPGATEGLRSRGIDPHVDGIPVVPAAHYMCGGVKTDLTAGTTLPGLYASGEVACTGLHGANRLASNSLLEAVVFSHRGAKASLEWLGEGRPAGLAQRLPGGVDPDTLQGRPAHSSESDPSVARARDQLRAIMWKQVGIVRDDARLEAATGELAALTDEHEARWDEGPWSPERVELRNLLQTGQIVVACAWHRRESRGLHYTLDHPYRDNERFLCDTDAALGTDSPRFALTGQP